MMYRELLSVLNERTLDNWHFNSIVINDGEFKYQYMRLPWLADDNDAIFESNQGIIFMRDGIPYVLTLENLLSATVTGVDTYDDIPIISLQTNRVQRMTDYPVEEGALYVGGIGWSVTVRPDGTFTVEGPYEVEGD